MTLDKHSLSTVRRSLNILRHLENFEDPLTLTQLATEENVTPTMALRCLKTLESGGFVRRDERKRYSLVTEKDRQVTLKLGIEICGLLAGAGQKGVTASELSDHLGTSQQTIYKALEVLTDEGMANYDAASTRWRIDAGIMRFTRPVVSDHFLSGTIRPFMKTLLDSCNETISWLKPIGHDQVVVETLPSLHAIRFVLDVGARYPCYIGSAGKAQLSTYTEEDFASYLRNLIATPMTDFMVDPEYLVTEIRIARERGYAISTGERVEGASSVAAPIYNMTGELEGVVSVMMPSNRSSLALLENIGRDLSSRIAEIFATQKTNLNTNKVNK